MYPLHLTTLIAGDLAIYKTDCLHSLQRMCPYIEDNGTHSVGQDNVKALYILRTLKTEFHMTKNSMTDTMKIDPIDLNSIAVKIR